jgi:enoyl-CoA hydratase/carnithine racemase
VTLTLNRPRQFNSLSEKLLAELGTALEEIGENRTVRVVVLAAVGKAFCAGHDLKEMRTRPEQSYYERLFAQCSDLMLSLRKLPQPVIARVQGLATAAGCQLVASCDMAVASSDARFAVSGINVGLFCSTPGVALSRNILPKQAFEMLFTGDFVDAEKACAQGLVNRVSEPHQLDEEIGKLTGAVCAKSSVAVETGKRMFYRQLEMDTASAYAFASQVMACNMMTEDVAEGIDAFTEKRPPRWQGR